MRPSIASCVCCALAVAGEVSAFLAPLSARGSLSRNVGTRAPSNGSRRSGVVMMGRRAEKIAKTKGKEDARRGKVFARMGKKIIMAVKTGGPSEESNKLLADTLRECKTLNVPKDNIARAIKRATEGSQGDFKEAVYEAYGHGGAGLVVSALTDNPNRAVADIKVVFKKHDLKPAAQGSVLFQFSKRGRIEVEGKVDEEKVIEMAIESDVEDVEVVEGDSEGTSFILTDPKDLVTLADALSGVGVTGEAALALVPQSLVDCSEEELEKNLGAIEALEALDDVDMVDHNMA